MRAANAHWPNKMPGAEQLCQLGAICGVGPRWRTRDYGVVEQLASDWTVHHLSEYDCVIIDRNVVVYHVFQG